MYRKNFTIVVPSSASCRSNALIWSYRFDQTSGDHRGRDDQHVLVVRPIEDLDLAGARDAAVDAPQVVVGKPPRTAP